MIMKKMRLFISGVTCLLMVFGISATTYASGDVKVVRTPVDSKSKLHVQVPETYDLSVFITDESGVTVYADYLKAKSSPGKLYNLANLEDGKYTITTEAAHQTVIKSFNIKDGEIVSSGKLKDFEPYFSKKNNKLIVNYLNENMKDISLTIEDDYRIYLEDKSENKLAYGKIVNTENMPRGYYTVTLEAGENIYKYYFDKF